MTRMLFEVETNSQDPDIEGLLEFLEEIIRNEVKDWLKECRHADQQFKIQTSITYGE